MKGFSLSELSERSAVAPSTILKVESRQMVPSVAVIFKIAAGLEIPLADLIEPDTADVIEIDVQAAGTHGRLQTSKDFFFEQLSSSKLKSDLHLWRVNVGAHGSIRFRKPQPFEQQIAVGEHGTIEMGLDDGVFTLNVGDSIHVLNRSLVSLRNPGTEPASYLVTGTLPKAKLFRPVVVTG